MGDESISVATDLILRAKQERKLGSRTMRSFSLNNVATRRAAHQLTIMPMKSFLLKREELGDKKGYR